MFLYSKKHWYLITIIAITAISVKINKTKCFGETISTKNTYIQQYESPQNIYVNKQYAMLKDSSKLDKPYGVCWHITRKWQEGEFLQDGANQVRTFGEYVRCGLNASKYIDTPPPTTLPYDAICWYDSVENTLSTRNIMLLSGFTTFNRLQESEVTQERMNNYKGWVKLFVSHFKKKIFYWEVFNELDLHQRKHNWSDKLVMSIYKTTYQAIKEANPEAKVLIGGLTKIKDCEYLSRLHKYGIENYFDIMNFHIYPNSKSLEKSIECSTQMFENLFSQWGKPKPIWITETGCNTFSNSEDTQCSIIPRIMMTSIGCGIKKVFVYSLRDNPNNKKEREQHYGITYKDVNKGKKVLKAIQTLTHLMPSGSERPQISKYGNIYVAKWHNPNGMICDAFWTSEDNVKVKFNFGKNMAEIIDHRGIKKIVSKSQNMKINNSIIYIIGCENLSISEVQQ